LKGGADGTKFMSEEEQGALALARLGKQIFFRDIS
jgi:hypothetical protein